MTRLEHGTGKRGPLRELQRPRLDAAAAEMRAKYLTTGKGCKTRAKVIAQRTGGKP